MYNPASILHTVEKSLSVHPRIAVFTLGTNHVYILKETGEIVDNCQKRPQRLFEERELSVDECADYLQKAIDLLKAERKELSKATLLLAADKLLKANPGVVSYFPAYEIMNDELRDYRFYKEDMLHPSDQAVEYIWEKFRTVYFGKAAEQFLEDWRPIREALGHRPFNPDSEEHKKFIARTEERKREFEEKYLLL